MYQRTCIWIAVIGVLVGSASAQVTTGIISGTVKDSTGLVISGASVKIIHQDTGTSREAASDPFGHFVFPQLALGEYEVTASMSGFKSEVRKGIVLTVGREAVLDFMLQVGAVTEQVVVTADTPLIETKSSSLAGLVDEKQVRDLPLNGRSFDQLINLTTGTVQFSAKNRNIAMGFTSGFSSGGARWESSKFTWDGIELLGSSSVATTPNSASGKLMGVEAIREFAVVTNNGDATQGKKFGGSINIITRSGTNSFHGTAYWFLRNNHLDTRNFFDRFDLPQFKQNNFGAALGGPIHKDKTWFFGNYEGFRSRLGLSNVAFVPDANARRGILPLPDPANPGQVIPTQVPLSPGIVPLFAFYPEPNGRNLGGGIAEGLSSPSEKINQDFVVARLDHNISDLQSIYGHYIFDNASQSSPRVNPHFILVTPTRSQQASVSLKSTFSATVLNSFTAGFSRAAGLSNITTDIPIPPSLITEPGSGGIGAIQVPGLNELGGYNLGALLAGRYQNRNVFTYSDQLNLSRGKHFLQMGSQIERIQANENQGTTRRGNIQFLSLADFLRGLAQTLQGPAPGSSGIKGWRQTYVSFFLQDSYRLSSNFTLNAGVRYEFMTNVSEVNGRISNFALIDNQLTNPMGDSPVVRSTLFSKNNSLKGIAPRVGFAWDVFGRGRTAVRGGVGIFYNQIEDDFRRALGANPPFFTVLSASNIPFPQTTSALAGSSTAIRPFGVWATGEVPTLLQYNFRIEQSVGGTTRIGAAYVGSHGYHLSRFTDPQVANPSVVNGRLFYPQGTVRKNLRFATSGVGIIPYDSISSYNSLQVDLEQRLTKGLRFKVAYTWAKSIDDSSGTLALTGSSTTSLFPWDHKGDRGFSNFDVPHTFVLNWTYELPLRTLFRKANRLTDAWELSGILTAQSGLPFTAEVGFPRSGNGTTNTGERPDLAPGRSNSPVLGGPNDAPKYFDTSAFLLQPAGFVGNLARNTVRGPGITTADMAVQKGVRFTETFGLQIRGEVFNLLNHPNFNLPTVRQVFNAQGAILSTAGVISSTSTSSRQIQLSLKLTF